MPEQEERIVRRLAADDVGERRPEEPSADVEQREQAGEARGNGRHERCLRLIERGERDIGLADQTPPKISCSIGEAMPITPMPALTFRHSTPQISQNCARLVRVAQMHLARRDQRVFAAGARPALGLPAGGGRR